MLIVQFGTNSKQFRFLGIAVFIFCRKKQVCLRLSLSLSCFSLIPIHAMMFILLSLTHNCKNGTHYWRFSHLTMCLVSSNWAPSLWINGRLLVYVQNLHLILPSKTSSLPSDYWDLSQPFILWVRTNGSFVWPLFIYTQYCNITTRVKWVVAIHDEI